LWTTLPQSKGDRRAKAPKRKVNHNLKPLVKRVLMGRENPSKRSRVVTRGDRKQKKIERKKGARKGEGSTKGKNRGISGEYVRLREGAVEEKVNLKEGEDPGISKTHSPGNLCEKRREKKGN